jgi:hypothetical protein
MPDEELDMEPLEEGFRELGMPAESAANCGG